MILYLAQHAEAASEAVDPTRDLTEKGRSDIEALAHHLERLGIQVSQIFHSGKTRAASTAHILGKHLKPAAGISQAPGLAPLDDPQIWGDRLATLNEDTMLVGHLPHLGRLAGLLMSGDQDRNTINFKMGSVVRLARQENGHWAIDWMLIPDMIL